MIGLVDFTLKEKMGDNFRMHNIFITSKYDKQKQKNKKTFLKGRTVSNFVNFSKHFAIISM